MSELIERTDYDGEDDDTEVGILQRIVARRFDMWKRSKDAPMTKDDIEQREIDWCEARLRLLKAQKALQQN